MTEQATETVFPTETIDLPSKGMFYPEGSPLRSGQIELRYMTAKHEDILTSPNLIQKGVVLDRLIDALIATKGVKSADLFIGDLNAVMVAARILGYGKDYDVTLPCPNCGNEVEQVVNLAELDMENEPTSESTTQFKVILPMSKAEVTLKLLTRGDELAIEKEMKSLKKINTDVNAEATTRLKNMIVAVNGDTSSKTIWNFVDNLLVRDARYLREQYRNVIPDVNFNVSIECTCGTNQTVRLPMAQTFFGLTQEYKAEVLKIIMMVAHYSKGAFSVMDLYNMPVYMRNFFIREFGKLKEDESKQIERANKGR